MKWQAIANVTSQINEEAKNYLVHKLQKDASVELPTVWADFITETSSHLHDSQSNIEIAPNSKTGGLSCVTKFDELHPDFLDNNKPFINYALEKYDKRAASMLSNIKNPFTRRSLQSKIGDYRTALADNINHTEIKLIDGKRHTMAIESIEKLKNATHSHPEIYQSHLQDCYTAINSLSLLPLEKEQLTIQAKSELAGAAAQGMLKRSPDSLINQSRLPLESQPLWMQDLSLEQRIKLDNQVAHLIHQKQAVKQAQVKQLVKSHFASILKTGEGVKGFDNLLKASFAPNDPNYQKIKQQEASYKQSFAIADQIKHASLNDGVKILEALEPKRGDPDFYNKEQIYNIAVKLHSEQLKEAMNDPAKFVEELFSEEMPKDLSFGERVLLRQTLQEQKGIPSYGQQYLTKTEKAEFIRKIENSKDINEIRDNINGIISLRNDNGNNYGLEVMHELLQGRDSEQLVSFYAENALYGNSKIANIFLSMIPYKGQLFNKAEESLINKEIAKDADKIIGKWERGFYNSDTQNIEEINHIKGQIKYLALHYTKSGELSRENAVKRATREIIEDKYMALTRDKLQIPKQIIADNMIHNLNEDYIEAGLLELQRGIISGSVNYDYNTSFGIADTNIMPNEAEIKKLREVLSYGKWKLTPDKKSVYFTYPTKQGEYLPIMQQDRKILKFDLVDLNNPESLSRQKQSFINALRNSSFEM